MKVIFFLNTFTKMQDYDILRINLLDYRPVAIVSNCEKTRYEDEYRGFFHEIVAVEHIEFGLIKSVLEKYFKNYNLVSIDTRIICLSEDNLLVAGMLRDFFNIPGMTYHQSNLFRDKVRMKEALMHSNILLPKYIDLLNIADHSTQKFFNELTKRLGRKFVIKPKAEFGGNGVHIISSYSDFIYAINLIKEDISLYEAETFINGELYHIDSVHVDGSPIFQVCCKYSFPNFDFQLGKPSLSIPVPDNYEIVDKAKKLTREVLNALNYKSGTSHLEFFVDNGETVFLEVAARTPGANTTPIYEKMYGFNMLNADLHINIGLKVEKPVHNGTYCIRGIFPKRNCTVKKLNMPEVIGEVEIQWKIKENEILTDCSSLRDIAAKILVMNSSYESAKQDFEYLSTFDVIN